MVGEGVKTNDNSHLHARNPQNVIVGMSIEASCFLIFSFPIMPQQIWILELANGAGNGQVAQ